MTNMNPATFPSSSPSSNASASSPHNHLLTNQAFPTSPPSFYPTTSHHADATTSSVMTKTLQPLDTSLEMKLKHSHNALSIAPYWSMEGRRKRRRTTVEDAFSNLSLSNTDPLESSIEFSPPPPPPPTSPTANDTGMTTPSQDCIKRLRYDTPDHEESSLNNSMMDASFEQKNSLISSTPYGVRPAVSRRSMVSSPPTFFDKDVDSCSTTTSSSSSCHSLSPPEDRNGGAGGGMDVDGPRKKDVPLVFAPRKAKSRNSTRASTSSRCSSSEGYSNPVDERLEELIRHSRIQAYVQQQQAEKQQHQQAGQSTSSRLHDIHKSLHSGSGVEMIPHADETLRHLYQQQTRVKDQDCGDVYTNNSQGGCALRRKSLREDVKKGVETTSNTTQDDFHIGPVGSNGPGEHVRGRNQMTAAGTRRRSKSLPRTAGKR